MGCQLRAILKGWQSLSPGLARQRLPWGRPPRPSYPERVGAYLPSRLEKKTGRRKREENGTGVITGSLSFPNSWGGRRVRVRRQRIVAPGAIATRGALKKILRNGWRRRRKGIRWNHPPAGIRALTGVAGGPNLGGHQVPPDFLFHDDASLHLVAEINDDGQNFARFQEHDFVVFSIHSHHRF